MAYSIFDDFRRAVQDEDGYLLASTITPRAPEHDGGRLYDFYRTTNHYSVQTDFRYAIVHNNTAGLSKTEGNHWLEVYVVYWKAIGQLLVAEELTNQGKDKEAEWNKVYDAWRDVANALIKGYSSSAFPAWTIPCLYVAGKYLRAFAIKSDAAAAKFRKNTTFNAGLQDDIAGAMSTNEKLEDAARQINRMFSLCISDRAPLEESRKWGVYYTTNLLFKTYFKLNAIGLSKNILRSLQATKTDMPPLEAFPKSHQVTFKYYVGVILFLEEDYVQAEENLTEAWQLCHQDAQKNRELILTYLVPCHLLTTHTLPTFELLAPYPRLQQLFAPLGQCIKRGDLAGFDAALAAGEDEFVKRRIYLTLERGRDIALRNLFRKVFVAGGFEDPREGDDRGQKIRKTRVPIAEFGAALMIGMGHTQERMEQEEVECLIANMIYKNLMKGYISRTHSMLVLNKKGAFPGTGI
ncbi:hypothetical protein B0A49_03455 [Cryomyces minteri]|uniref:Protein CSN12 homolog n=1 Tax=Cryomyces minteri TaxID=331657 RepID=A0A4U0XJW5_9PEZI|nr:hypothetical protein B0A49_03979 [Cryomyces minteri]TKA76507.1 hypothetical protein B0A49_03455 [Cryomyces minteri]